MMPSQQLKDIKPPIPIDDWSVYLYWGVVGVSVIVLGVALYLLVKTLLGLRRTRRHHRYLSALKQIDWIDTKKSAYDATRLGRMLLGSDERLHELYRQMTAELSAYKYKKETPAIDDKARAQFDLFVRGCDESL